MKLFLFLYFFVLSINIQAEEQPEFFFTMNSDNHLVVFGTVHNTTGYFIIDTGSIDIILFDSIQDLPETTSIYSSYTMLGETFESKSHVVSGITLGNAVINEELAVIHAPETIKNIFPIGVRGLINIFALDGKAVEISFSERKIRLLDDVPAAYTESVSFIRLGAFCFIPIVVNNKEYLFRIDTGSNDTINFPEIVLNAIIDKNNIYQVAAGAYHPETNNNNYYLFKNTAFTLFNHTYKNVVCQTSFFDDKENFGVIGTKILQCYDIVFDPATEELFYKPLLPDILYDTLFIHESKSAGLLGFDYTGDSLFVRQVIINSPVWKAGLRPGYRITKVNDYDTAGIPQSYLTRTFQSNDKIKLEYYNEDNKKKTVKVKPKILLK